MFYFSYHRKKSTVSPSFSFPSACPLQFPTPSLCLKVNYSQIFCVYCRSKMCKHARLPEYNIYSSHHNKRGVSLVSLVTMRFGNVEIQFMLTHKWVSILQSAHSVSSPVATYSCLLQKTQLFILINGENMLDLSECMGKMKAF